MGRGPQQGQTSLEKAWEGAWGWTLADCLVHLCLALPCTSWRGWWGGRI